MNWSPDEKSNFFPTHFGLGEFFFSLLKNNKKLKMKMLGWKVSFLHIDDFPIEIISIWDLLEPRFKFLYFQ